MKETGTWLYWSPYTVDIALETARAQASDYRALSSRALNGGVAGPRLARQLREVAIRPSVSEFQSCLLRTRASWNTGPCWWLVGCGVLSPPPPSPEAFSPPLPSPYKYTTASSRCSHIAFVHPSSTPQKNHYIYNVHSRSDSKIQTKIAAGVIVLSSKTVTNNHTQKL